MKFKAVILVGKNQLVVEEIENTPLSEDQVFVKIEQAGLCGAQLLEMELEKGNEKLLPHLLGHEGYGEVIDKHPSVAHVEIGDKVVIHWRERYKSQCKFPQYIWNERKISAGKATTFSEYSTVSGSRISKLNTEKEIGSLLGCCLSTAMGVVQNEFAFVPRGGKVLILGGGGLGLSIGYLTESEQCLIVDRYNKFEQCKSIGRNFSYTLPEPEDKFDNIVDTTGSSALISSAFENLADNGNFIMLTHCKSPLQINTKSFFSPSGKKIIFTQGGGFEPQYDLIRYASNLKTSNFNYNLIVSHRFPLEEINTAVETLRSGLASRILLDL
jgi:2-desacetyl-2-hydroxyethyl bacteriochlorophyllide A dehydrogenase